MRKIFLILILFLSIGISFPALAVPTVGINYTIAYDNAGTSGDGMGIQVDFYNIAENQKIRVIHMNLNGSYYTGVKWSASLTGMGYIFDFKNDTKWTPYAGIGVVNVSITALLNNNAQTALMSPATIVGVRYLLSNSFDIYSEINSIGGTQGITAGLGYKF